MISFAHVYKTYPNGDEPPVHALSNVDLEIEKGDFVFLTGPSGAGKTTLFKMISGFDQPTSGAIQVAGYDLARLRVHTLPFFRRRIGVVFQDFKLLKDRSVFENVALPLEIKRESAAFIRKRVSEVLAQVGLDFKSTSRPDHLSGGEQQRVAIARAIVHQPGVLIADEPTGNLDAGLSAEIMDLFKRVNAQGTTVFIATHDLSLLEKHPHHRRVQLRQGFLAVLMKNLGRSWRHHLGMQITTLSVLTAMFSIMIFSSLIALNLRHLMVSWGDSLQVTAYLQDEATPLAVTELQTKLKSWSDVKSVELVDKSAATAAFKTQMASYAPGLLSDTDMSNPFPASLKITLADAVGTGVEKLADRVRAQPGIEDVSYGQNWIHTYSAIVNWIQEAGLIVIGVLFIGSLLIVGNSIRASIASRREEIEVLELIGATSYMIRRPHIIEGALLTLSAAALALGLNFVFYHLGVRAVESSAAVARVSTNLIFLNAPSVAAVLVASLAMGALGASLTLRHLNDGWAASQRSQR